MFIPFKNIMNKTVGFGGFIFCFGVSVLHAIENNKTYMLIEKAPHHKAN